MLRESRNFSLLHKEQMIFTLHFLKKNERNSLWHHGLGTTFSTTFLANLLHVHKCVSHHESYSKINLEHKDKDKDNDKHKTGFYPGFVKCISHLDNRSICFHGISYFSVTLPKVIQGGSRVDMP